MTPTNPEDKYLKVLGEIADALERIADAVENIQYDIEHGDYER
jgi:hypothetical protein